MFKDIVSFDKLQELIRQSIKILQEIKSKNKNWLEKLKRADPKPDYLINFINYIISYNIGLKGSKKINLLKLVNK
jgi:hypothetical protein